MSAARWTTAISAVRTCMQLAQLIVLTRFLSPKDYGLMAMAMVVISFAALFSDMGLSSAFVQRQSVTQEERSSLYWLTVMVGAVLMLIVMAISPLAAAWMGSPELMPLMILVSTNFLTVALGQQLRMDAEKQLNFRPVALIEIAAAISGFAVALFAAAQGWGAYALAAAAVFGSWVTTISSWALLANGWRPLPRMRWREVQRFLRFGGGMMVNNVFNYANSTLDLLLGGRILGAASLGLYSVPRSIILQVQGMVNPIFTRVGFPVIASIQHDRERVKRTFLMIMNITATVNAPIYMAIAAFAPEIVQLLLGKEFQDTAPLLRMLAAWGLFRSFGNPAGSLVFGMGRVRLATWWNLGLLAIVPPAIWLGSGFGAEGMASAMAVVMAALFIPGWAILVKPCCDATLREYFRQVLSPTLSALFAALVAWFAVSELSHAYVRLALGLSMGIVIYAAMSWLLNRACVNLIMDVIRQPASVPL